MRDSHHPVTIKTSAPSLDGVIERARLVNALTKLPAAARWLQAPSGTGKSTLAASYARSRKKPLVWYRLDERDNDPAFFYAEFAQAVRTQLRLTRQLPKFSSDDHERQQEFAQRFAAALSEQLTKPALIVLDDAQCITNAAMQRALASLTAAVGSGIELLFVSQSTAPTAFFDAIAARQLALLNDADLRFDLDECRALISALRMAELHSESIAALTGGHAGALVLACELLRGTDPKSALGVETVERIHSHLLTKLVERMPEQRRELLLQTAFVTQLTRPIATTLAGADAARELDALVEKGLLRRVGVDKTESFEAHGLVRQGMQALARLRIGQQQATALAERTAIALIENAQTEAAFALLVEIGSTVRAIEVMQYLAEHYAKRGQVALLTSSIAKLPTPEVQSNAWLCFWSGQALLGLDEEQARIWLGHAYSAFECSDDLNGMRLAAASVVIAYALETGDRRELDSWIDRHRRAGGDSPVPQGDRHETTLIMGVACAAFVESVYPEQIDSDALIERLRLLLESEEGWLSDDQRVQAARILVEQGHVFMKYELAKTAIIATRFLIDRKIGSALQRGRWLTVAAIAHFEQGDTTRSLSLLNEAQSIAEASQSSRLSFEIGLTFAKYWMKASNLHRATEELCRLEAIATSMSPAERAEHARLMARLLLLQDRLSEGLRFAQEAKRLAIPAGFTGASVRAYNVELAYALAANDQLTEAIDLLSEQEFEPREARLALEHCLRFLVGGRSDLDLLRSGLRNAAQIGFINMLDRARTPLTVLCEAALAHDIETEFVQRLISTKQLRPPPDAGPHWPWAVKIRTLGGFRLEVEGQPYRPTHKAQEKPLDLLKLLVTCEALGRDSAEKTWIYERLWPDADSEKARKSLEMTVARLRKLLRSEQSILAAEGRLQLSQSHAWTDIRLLRQALSHARTQRDEAIALKPVEEAGKGIAAVLAHYSGPFMAGEEGPPWLLAGREAVAAAVRHALVSADSLLNGSADESLIPALEKALVADPTSEDLARSLMRAHLRRRNRTEAIRVYRRLRDMLSLLLGVAPSAESKSIFDQAYSASREESHHIE